MPSCRSMSWNRFHRLTGRHFFFELTNGRHCATCQCQSIEFLHAEAIHIVEARSHFRAGEPAETSGAQSIARAAGLLRSLAGARGRGASLGELVDWSGLAKPTCRRMLIALIEAGFVEQDADTRRYFLGPEAYVLGLVAAERFGLDRLAEESVRRLAEAAGDAAFLQVRRDVSIVCLKREDGDYPLRSHVLAPGDRHPLGVGAGGTALLAALPDDEVEQVLDANAHVLAERYPMLSRPLMLDLVAEARTLGYGVNRGLIFPGSWGMAVAVRSPRSRVEACLSLAAVEARMQPDRQPELYRLLRTEADRLEARLCSTGDARAARLEPT